MSSDKPEQLTFTADRIEAEGRGYETPIWTHPTVVQKHELTHGFHESNHKVLAGDGSTGERPDIIILKIGSN